MACYDFSGFGEYFEENMNAIGLPGPSDLFGSVTTAYANIHELSAAVALGRSLGCGILENAGFMHLG